MKLIIAMIATALFTMQAYAQSPAADLEARFVGRVGTASEDRRVNEFAARSFLGPGPRTGCHGNTYYAGVTLNKVDVSLSGHTATVKANYGGKYTRQGWITGCIQAPPPSGREDVDVHGVITFTLTQIPFKAPVFKIVGISNVGQITDPNHESNAFAGSAAAAAVASAL